MKTSKFVVALAALSLLSLPSFQNGVLETKGEATSLSGSEIQEVYNLGEYIYIAKDTVIQSGDKSVKVASSVLTYPDGTKQMGSAYKLDAFGSYEITCYGEDGTIFTKKFNVYQDVYSFNGNKSTIDYGNLNKFFAGSGYAYGLKLGLTEGDTFTYAKPIDLSKSKYQKLMAWNIIDLEQKPTVHSITLRVTDAYDPNNYFTITNSKGTYYYENYVTTSYNGARNAGLIADDSGSVEVDGKSYRINSQGGTRITGNSPVSKSMNNVSYYLDSADPSHYRIYAATDAASEYVLVAEFNNAGIYGNDTFKGFKNGLVYMSVTASGYSGVELASLEIGEIGGVRGDELNPMDYYKDRIAPIFDHSEDEEAKIMGGLEIEVPVEKAYDETGLRGEATYSVYYGYDSSAKRLVAVKDGKFLPDQKGVYTILYRAEDVYGNVSTKRLDLSVSEFGSEGLKMEVVPLENMVAGKTVQFNNFTMESLNDDAVVEIEVTSPHGEKKTVSSLDSYLLERAGTYTLQYRYHDRFYSGEKEYSFTVSANNKAEFTSKDVYLPHYFMKGATYSLDAPAAYGYNENGAQQDEVVGEVQIDGKDYVAFDPTSFTADGTTCKFRFYPKSNPTDIIETETIPVVDANWNKDGKRVDLTKYFVGDFEGKNVEISEGENADFVRYQSKVAGKGKMEFINKLLFSPMQFNFKASGVGAVTLRFLPYYGGDEITIRFEKTGVSVNGKFSTGNEDFLSTGASLLYSSATSTLTVAGANFQIENPFVNDAMFLQIEAEGLSTSSYLDISYVGNQPFRSGSTRDRIAPMASYEFPEKIAKLNETASISKPNVADVLSPAGDEKLSISVIKNIGGSVRRVKDLVSGQDIYEVRDFSHAYSFRMDEYASYIMNFVVMDGFDNAITGGFKGMVSVLDGEKPVINSLPSTHKIKANTQATLPNITATDNMTASDKIEIWHLIYDSEGVLIAMVPNGNAVNIKDKGTYTAHVTCQDEEGNVAYGQYTLIVE